jgi:phosphoribosylaminoimidazole-succinocarboxamide synthase
VTQGRKRRDNPGLADALTIMPTIALHASALHSLPLIARGKVRDNYAVGDDRLLMVASDRVSAFDVIMGEPIPGKGALLTRMALFWFGRLAPIVPNHLTGQAPESVVAPAEADQVRGRSMLVKRLKPLPIEAVVRGYLAGSGWKEYQQSGRVCGVALPPGLGNAARLPEPIFTPATKAEAGAHDENITFDQAAALIGSELAARVRDVSIRLYTEAAAYAAGRGIVIADTKFEFGLDSDGTLTLMDEVLTPDSSRFWAMEGWAEAARESRNPPGYDKQYLRDWLEQAEVDGQPWNKRAPAPALPAEVVRATADRYEEAARVLMGSNSLSAASRAT